MVNTNHTLPDDIESLKKLVLAQKEIINSKDIELKSKEDSLQKERLKYQLLEEQFKVLQTKFFGKRSEKLTVEDELQG